MPKPQNQWSGMHLHGTSSQAVCHSCAVICSIKAAALMHSRLTCCRRRHTHTLQRSTSHSRSHLQYLFPLPTKSQPGLASHLHTVAAMLKPNPIPMLFKPLKCCYTPAPDPTTPKLGKQEPCTPIACLLVCSRTALVRAAYWTPSPDRPPAEKGTGSQRRGCRQSWCWDAS